MRTGQDVLRRALHLLKYPDKYTCQDADAAARGLAIVNQIYCDVWHTGQREPFIPLTKLDAPLLLPQKQLQDVMPYGVAMLLALSEGDGDNQQVYATLYNRKRIAAVTSRRRVDVLFKRPKGDCV